MFSTIAISTLMTLSAGSAELSTRAHLDAGGRWILSGSLGVDSFTPAEARWLGEHGAELRLDVHRHLLDLIGRWYLRAGLDYRATTHGPTSAGLDMLEVEIAGELQFPQTGLFGFIYPYAHLGLSGGAAWVASRDSDGNVVEDLAFVPGVAGGAGVRAIAPSRKSIRLFAFAEAGYAQRKPVSFKLQPREEVADELIGGPPTRMGRVDLSGYAWRLGAGFAW